MTALDRILADGPFIKDRNLMAMNVLPPLGNARASDAAHVAFTNSIRRDGPDDAAQRGFITLLTRWVANVWRRK